MDAQPHAVLVAGPGLGHVNGCVLLANTLVDSAGFSVTLACFARSYSTHASQGRIKPLHPSVRLQLVPDGLPLHLTPSYHDLFSFHPSMHLGLLHLLRNLSLPATCLISDTIMAWTQDVADEVGIPRVDYWTATATSYLFILGVPDLLARGLIGCHKGPQPLGWKSKEPILLDCIPGIPSFPVPVEFLYAESVDHPVFQMFLKGAQRAKDADCVLIHTEHNLERDAFEGFKQIGFDAYPIGPLLHLDATSPNNTHDTTLTWLNSRATASVIFVSFGSNVIQTEDEIVELALGLEASKHAFLWVIRCDAVAKGRDLADVLPPGFQSRTREQGLIISWVSQPAVLGHPAVGGFLSHCGWNSTLESLWMGVPILACPKRAEQPLNGRFIVKEWNVGIELETSENGTFASHHVENGVRALLDGTHGKLARTKAKELSLKLREAPLKGGYSHSKLLEFASKMKKLRLNNPQNEELCLHVS